MLIYVNRLWFEPESGPGELIEVMAKWVGQRSKGFVDPERLAAGIAELRFRDGSTLSSRCTAALGGEITYPYLFCTRYSHRDAEVSGRKWITEIGLRQEAAGRPVECSVLLCTDEVSARVTTPIQVTRPRVVELLTKAVRPMADTPGQSVKRLDEASAQAFAHAIEREGRTHPVVVVSAARDGAFAVEPERLRGLLIGLADVVVVPAEADTFAIEQVVGRRHMAFGGAINIVFAPRRASTESAARAPDTVLLRAEALAEMQAQARSVQSEVLALVTHRCNLPMSWGHISPEKVNHARLRNQLAALIDRSKTSEHADELAEYIALLQAADDDIRGKEQALEHAQAECESRDDEVRALKAEVYGLKQALAGMQSSAAGTEGVPAPVQAVRETAAAAIRGTPSLQQAIELVGALYAERVVFLESAAHAARDSDRNGFRLGDKAFELLHKLATDYWQALADGQGDQQAKGVFGHSAYAANEAGALSNDGKRLRTFTYRGQPYLMEKHLKHGVKDSYAETLRIHFCWIASEQRIVIGHCGKHLNF